MVAAIFFYNIYENWKIHLLHFQGGPSPPPPFSSLPFTLSAPSCYRRTKQYNAVVLFICTPTPLPTSPIFTGSTKSFIRGCIDFFLCKLLLLSTIPMYLPSLSEIEQVILYQRHRNFNCDIFRIDSIRFVSSSSTSLPPFHVLSVLIKKQTTKCSTLTSNAKQIFNIQANFKNINHIVKFHYTVLILLLWLSDIHM